MGPGYRRKSWVLLLLCLPLIACGLGVRWNLPWLAAEHQRLEPWKIPFIWLTELTAAFWYLQFLLSYCYFGEGTEAAADDRPHRRHRLWVVVLSFLISIAGDVTISLLSMSEEFSAHASALPAQGQVLSGREMRLRNGGAVLILTCRFQDAQGAPHDATLYLGRSEVPPPVQQAIAAGQLPVDLAITYDPLWPGRNWIEGGTDPHHNRLYMMSFSTILFSGILAVLLIRLRWDSQGTRLPSEKISPFLGVTTVLFLSGVGKLLLGEV